MSIKSFSLGIAGADVEPPPAAPAEIKPELMNTLQQQFLDQQELLRTVSFGDPASEPEILGVRHVVEKTPASGGLLQRVQENAMDFSTEGAGANGLTIDAAIGTYTMAEKEDIARKRQEKDAVGTQTKISDADLGEGPAFDEGGANVATPDSGAGEKLYAEPTIGNWGDDEDGDDPVSRAQVGLEDEMVDDPSQVPAGMLDDD